MNKLVLEIIRMTNHNGPGFRTLVLFKGCPLHCVWCSTPESQRIEVEIGINQNRCAHCGRCVDTCPGKALTLTDEELLIDRKACIACGTCERGCAWKAITLMGKPMSPEELLKEIQKDKVLYKNSGGGVTFSGGEPLFLDPEYNRTLFRLCKEDGIQVGVQTCGHVPWENIESVLPYVDFFLWDVKQMDPEKHRKYTGAGNERILDNLRKVSEYGTPVHIRVPVIAGFNDTEENLRQICDLVKPMKNIAAFDLLPMHHLGKIRYEKLGKEYPIDNVPLIDKQVMQRWKKFVENQGISCRILG